MIVHLFAMQCSNIANWVVCIFTFIRIFFLYWCCCFRIDEMREAKRTYFYSRDIVLQNDVCLLSDYLLWNKSDDWYCCMLCNSKFYLKYVILFCVRIFNIWKLLEHLFQTDVYLCKEKVFNTDGVLCTEQISFYGVETSYRYPILYCAPTQN